MSRDGTGFEYPIVTPGTFKLQSSPIRDYLELEADNDWEWYTALYYKRVLLIPVLFIECYNAVLEFLSQCTVQLKDVQRLVIGHVIMSQMENTASHLKLIMDSNLLPIVFGFIILAPDFERVTDADEEVFILYSELQKGTTASEPSQKHRGLGHIDSRQNVMTVSIELKGGEISNITSFDSNKPLENVLKQRKRRVSKMSIKHRVIEDKTVEVSLFQDITALRSRKGDTGSVVWHASVDFAKFILQQAHMPLMGRNIFDFSKLREQHILELGGGTGVLSTLLSPLCREYTVTDIPDLIPLIKKNIALNIPQGKTGTSSTSVPLIHAIPLDWILLQKMPEPKRQAVYSTESNSEVDMLLIVDCIYHPTLLPPLIETINYLTIYGKTVVIVVVELRSEEVLREFLQIWLSSSPYWVIHRIPHDIFLGPYVMWVGWKQEEVNR